MYISNFLDEMYRLYDFNNNNTHGIRASMAPNWKIFESSHFIYSYFLFNSIYSIDWQKTLKEEKIIDWSWYYKKTGNGKDEKEKISAYIDFLHEQIGSNFFNLFQIFLKNNLKVDNPLEELEGIICNNIYESKKKKFIENFKLVYNEENVNKVKTIEELAKFVYLIRNNIFHGSKSAIEQMERKQRNRIKIYSSILNTLNHLLFYVGINHLKWRPTGINYNKINQFFVKWDKVFIWNGFRFQEIAPTTYDFSQEEERNIKYLEKILKKLGYSKFFKDKIFTPPNELIDKILWLKIVKNTHRGAEGGEPTDLAIMDTYMGGIIRTLNELGFNTHFSCDGHRGHINKIGLYNIDDFKILDLCLYSISDGKYGFKKVRHNIFTITNLNKREKLPSKNDYLLDVAELLYNNKGKLKILKEDFTKITTTLKLKIRTPRGAKNEL